MRKTLAAMSLLTWAAAVTPSWGAPAPAAGSKAWQLDFSFHDPQRITMRLPGDDKDTTFWYMLYTVTNTTGQDVSFFPSFELVTDTLQVVKAGEEISPTVYDAIAARHKKEFPFFAPPTKITGPLLQGADNARTSAAVFRTFDPSASAFSVHVGGLSGEYSRVINPAFDEQQPESDANARYFVLRRTLEISYAFPGDVAAKKDAVPARRDRKWVMK